MGIKPFWTSGIVTNDKLEYLLKFDFIVNGCLSICFVRPLSMHKTFQI